MIRRPIAPLTFVVAALLAGQAFAQGAFPAPLPGQAAPSNASPSPPVNGAAPSAAGAAASPFPTTGAAPITGSAFERDRQASADCMKAYAPLREEVEERGRSIKAAGERKAPPDEACKLIGSYGQSESKMIKYVEAHSAKCGIPPEFADRLKANHRNTESMQKKVCAVAQQARAREPRGPVGDFWPALGGEPAGPGGDFRPVR